MKRETNQKRKTLALAALSLGTVGVAAPASAATVLDFSGLGGNGTGIPDTYGDNLAGTPNIGLTWNDPGLDTSDDGFDSYNAWDGRGEVGQTDYGQLNPMSVFLTPDAGFGVFVDSFELDEFTGGGDSVVNWSLLGGGSQLFAGTWNDFSDAVGGNGGRTLITTGMDANTAFIGELELRLELVSGASSYQAMDNLSFDQVAIPEPSALALLGVGVGAAVIRRRRKKASEAKS